MTLLNMGTCGAVHVHVPNAYVPPELAKVEGGRSYGIPGPELLPWERLRQFSLDYVELGPPGWEHIAVLVSDEPFITPDMIAAATNESPLAELSSEGIAALYDRLQSAKEEAWAAATLSFVAG